MGKILLKNIDLIVTMDKNLTEIENGDIFIENNIIKDIGKNLEYNADRIINCEGLVAYPGFVNTHHHLFQTLTRNIPYLQDVKLFDWLVGLYEIWRELTPEGVYISALVGMAELLLTGCTTTTDHLYLFPKKQPKDLIDYEIKAAKDIGIRFIPTRGSMSRGKSKGGLPPDDVTQNEDEIMKDCERLVKTYHNPEKYSMLRIALAPCSPFSVTTELLKETANFAKKYNLRCHTHIAETLDEEEYCLNVYGKRPVEYMEEVGWLGENFWYAHCIYLNDDEIKLMSKTKTGVAHCPVSNLRLGSGIAPVAKMLENNVLVGLAVDGSASNDSSNMLFEMKLALLVHRVQSGVSSMPAYNVLKMATNYGAKILGFDEIGSLEKNKAADIALFKINSIEYAGALHDKATAILFAGNNQTTEYTIVNGKIVVEKGNLVNINKDEIFLKANEIAHNMLKNASTKTGINYYKRQIVK